MNLSSIGRTSVNTTDFVTILKSRSIHENIVKKLKLEHYKEFLDKQEENTFQAILERFQKKVIIVSPSNKDSTIKIKIRLKDKALAVKIANLFFVELKDYLEKTNYLSTTKNRKFTEKQLIRISEELKKAEVSLLKFKEDNKTVSLPDEINEYIKYLSELESQQLKSKIELKDISERIRVTSKSTSSFDQEWQNVIKEMEVAQAGLKSKEVLLEEAKNKYFSLLNSLPIKALTLARLERELKV